MEKCKHIKLWFLATFKYDLMEFCFRDIELQNLKYLKYLFSTLKYFCIIFSVYKLFIEKYNHIKNMNPSCI